MRSSLSFSLDSTEDAGLIKWLSSQPNRSATIRDALYVAMQTVPTVDSTAPLLAATRRIEAELNELKKLVIDQAGGFVTPSIQEPLVRYVPEIVEPPPGTTLDDLTKEINNVSAPPPPSDVLANLRKLK